MKRSRSWSWLWLAIGAAYFCVPLIATLDFSLRAKKDTLSFAAYVNVFNDPKFLDSFRFSLVMAVLTIVASVLLIVPTAYWVELRLPRLRPVIEFITLLPFVVPAVVLAFGLIKIYSRPPFPLVTSPALLVAAYVVLSFPYMYRAVGIGLRAVDVRTLTEAAQSLGASWPTILFRVILPNLQVALLSGAFLAFAIVMGEFTFASLLAWPAFGPYMNLQASSKVYEPSATAIISFMLTWGAIGIIQFLGRNTTGQSQLGGTR